MVADDVDHAAHRPVGIVDVGKTVDEARAEMEERRCRLVAHPVIPVGGAGHDALEEAQHAARPVDPVKRGDKMHLRRAGNGKTHLDPAADQRAHQAFRAVHLVSPLGFFSVLQVSPMLIRLLSIDTIY
jgi:hypothetical protein